jgi:hypothetical protein
VGAGAEEEMHLELRMCFKLLERAQWARGSVGGRRRAWRARKTAAGRTKEAAGQRVTRGVGREQEVALVR